MTVAPARNAEVLSAPARSLGRSLMVVQLLALIVAASALWAYFYAGAQNRVYGGRAEILYEAPEARTTGEAQRLIATQVELLRSPRVLDPVAEEFGLTTEELGEDLAVSEAGGADVIRLTVADPDPTRAVALAQAAASSYVREVQAAESPAGDRARTFLERRIAALTRELSALPADSPRTQLLLTQIGVLEDRLTEVGLEQITRSGATILTPATLLSEPIEPRPRRAAAAGALVGIFIASLVVLVLARLRPGRPPHDT